jgi:quercetin dioxygenase-like cupin family protein
MIDITGRSAVRVAIVVASLGLGWPVIAFDNTAAAKSPVVTQLKATSTTDAGQPIVLPATDAHVIASIFDIPPGVTLPVHQHPFPRYAYVLAGELRVTNVETGQATTYKAGDFVVEMVGQWHQGASIGDGAVKLLVIDQVEGNAAHTVLKQ